MSELNPAVVSVLWPLYLAGRVSPDTRRFIEDYLRDHPAVALALRAGDRESAGYAVNLATRIKRRLWGPAGLLQLAILFSGFAFGQTVSDTSFDVSPRAFIVTAAIAACFWTVFLVALTWRQRTVSRRA